MSTIAYMGWLGHKNIGDEACYEYIASLFPKGHKIVTWDAHTWKHPKLPDVCILGGGTIFDIRLDRRGKAMLNMINKGIPNIIWGSGVMPLTAPKRPVKSIMHASALKILQKSKFVGVRGPISQNNLNVSGFTGSQIIGDPAFVIKRTCDNKGLKSNRIAINIGDTHTNLFGSEAEIFNKTQELVNTLTSKGYEIVLFSMWPADNKFLLKIIGCTLRPFDQSTKHLMEFFSTCRCVVGEKLHAMVLSAAQEVPFISLGYREKCFDFAKSLDLLPYVIRTDDTALVQKTIGLVDSLENSYSEFSSKYIKYKKAYEQKHLNVATILQKLLQ